MVRRNKRLSFKLRNLLDKGMDFSEYLLTFVGRYHTKESDVVNIILGLTATFMAVFAITITFASTIPDVVDKLLIEISPVTLVIVGIIGFRKVSKNYNETVYQIELAVMENYDTINSKNTKEKNEILEELKKMLSSKPSSENPHKLKKLMS
jgi:hypothetical protein